MKDTPDTRAAGTHRGIHVYEAALAPTYRSSRMYLASG